jgi:hypothetical protein
MTLRKTTAPLVLVIFALMCTLPAATMVPSAIAQEEEDDISSSSSEDENLASGIVSEVLDTGGSGDAEDENAQDATNAATEDSNQGQDVDQDDISTFGDDIADLDDANVAVPLGIPINVQLEEIVEEEEEAAMPPEEEPPEFVAFCFQASGESFIRCFNTSEECAGAEEFLVEFFGFIISAHCQGFVTIPPNAADCTFTQDEQATSVSCIFP